MIHSYIFPTHQNFLYGTWLRSLSILNVYKPNGISCQET